MKELNPKHLAAVINQGPFFRHMSIQVTEIGWGISEVVTTIKEEHMNPFGSLHGGVYTSALDTAAYWAADCDLTEERGLVTIDIKVDLLAPILDQQVITKGARIKSGKTIFSSYSDGENRVVIQTYSF